MTLGDKFALQPLTPANQRVIEAARACILHDGVHATISDIARKAGVSRPTVYNHYRSMREVVAEVLTRELLTELRQEELPRNVDELVEYCVVATNKVRNNELLLTIIREEPELLLTYQFERLGRSQKAFIDILAYMINNVPGVHRTSPRKQAVFIMMLVQAATYSSRITKDLIDDEDWDRELAKVLEGYLK